jgi:phosphoglycerol transferase MdoB-like AlkP superfamily enzyme
MGGTGCMNQSESGNPSLSTARIGQRNRYGFLLFLSVSLVLAWTVLRVALTLQSSGESHAPWGDTVLAFARGWYLDLFVSLIYCLPLATWFLLIGNPTFAKTWHRLLLMAGVFVFWSVEVFLLAAEYFFFEEFHSRFNTVAVDYLLYPHEVFINIWDTYPVPAVLLLCGLLGAGWTVFAAVRYRGMWTRTVSFPKRLFAWLGLLAAIALMSPSVSLKGPRISEERLLNEIANNGVLSFTAAAWTHHLDYAAFYRTMPREEAYQRLRKLLQEPGAQFVEDGASILRHIAGDTQRPKLNVVIILEESLGSEFWGSLGRKEPTLTPEMDKLAAEEGMLFTQIYACGNRTVRGLEGVLSSFPPLPGDSIVKRDLSDNVETIARVLKRDGYNTLFLYGGRGVFDGMRPYAVKNGWDKFVEQKHFEKPIFTTIWGVSDEELMARSITEFRALNQSGKPFLGTILSVSNHKPFTYPPGRIPEDPKERKRENAVKYSDYALGQFFKAARQEAFWTNTIFAVIADHGARVYGSQRIPIASYEIPVLITGPAVVKQPSRVGTLGSSLDVSPTLLGLIGRPYDSLFFGRDLLKSPSEPGRALLNHNRDIGLYTDERMAILGLRNVVEDYLGDPRATEPKHIAEPGPKELEIEKDCVSIYQIADELYTGRKYRLDPR